MDKGGGEAANRRITRIRMHTVLADADADADDFFVDSDSFDNEIFVSYLFLASRGESFVWPLSKYSFRKMTIMRRKRSKKRSLFILVGG